MSIVVGDIGATNARFAVADETSATFAISERSTLASRGFSSFGDAFEAFFDEVPAARRCRRASLGVAGLVRGNRCEFVNQPWVVDGAELERRFGLASVHLLNDLEAAAWGLTVLDAAGMRTLREGSPEAQGNRVLVAPGTGLGEAALIWDGRGHLPVASEGGNTDFGPADELQIALWRFVARQQGYVSWEHVTSGPGLVTLFRFLLARRGEDEPEWLLEEIENGDAAAAISHRARERTCPRSHEALDLFFALLGAEAGNMALKFLASGGVYLVGGILPRLLPELVKSRFLTAFAAKGRYRAWLETVPVHLVVDADLGLRGAAVAHQRRDPR